MDNLWAPVFLVHCLNHSVTTTAWAPSFPLAGWVTWERLLNLSGTQFPHLQNGNENTHLPSQDQVIRVPSNSFLVTPISCLHSAPPLPACAPTGPEPQLGLRLPPSTLFPVASLLSSNPGVAAPKGNRVGPGGGGVGGKRGGAREGASCRTFQEPKPIPSGCWRLRAAGDPGETWPH